MFDISGYFIFSLLFIFFVVYFVVRRFTASSQKKLQKRQKAIQKNFRSGKHIWKPFNKKGFYYCNLCEELMAGVFCNSMSECTKCGYLVHNLCKYKSQRHDTYQKCKFVTTEKEQNLNPHQLVLGNLPFNSVCSVCNLICSSMYELKGAKCIWCQKCVHTECKDKLDDQCDYGFLKKIVIQPNQVKFTKPNYQSIISKSINKLKHKEESEQTETDLDIQVKEGWTIKTSQQQTPVVIVINKKSGGQMGMQFMSAFYKHLNPIQVIDLLSEGLERLKIFKDVKNLKILVCGGDGTVASVVNFLKESGIPQWQYKNPPVGILPIGTGNDLGRALGWGGGGQTEDEVGNILKQVDKKSQPILHDRWMLKFGNQEKCELVYNYFSFGLDARVCYGFHSIREKYPYLFKSRIGNKFIYTHVGTMDMLQTKTKMLIGQENQLNEEMELIVDGQKVELPEIENIAFVNISSWAGGAQNLWFQEKDLKAIKKNSLIYKPQSFCDGVIEVLGVTSMFHLGQVQININEPLRICQGKVIEIVLKKEQYMQIDGEPRLVKPQKIVLERKDQVNLLANLDPQNNDIQGKQTLQFESKILSTLEWAEDNKHIDAKQREVLLNKFLDQL